MKNPTRIAYLQKNPQERVKIWNEMLVNAAKDLAAFTQEGVYAKFIAELAQKCEAYEQQITKPRHDKDHAQLEAEIIAGINQICRTGQKIWKYDPEKRRAYSLNIMENSVFSAN